MYCSDCRDQQAQTGIKMSQIQLMNNLIIASADVSFAFVFLF